MSDLNEEYTLVKRSDIIDILNFREGTDSYTSAENSISNDMKNSIEFCTVEWWLLEYKSHYNNEGNIIIVPKVMTYLQIEKVVNDQYKKMLENNPELKSSETGYRWVKYDE